MNIYAWKKYIFAQLRYKTLILSQKKKVMDYYLMESVTEDINGMEKNHYLKLACQGFNEREIIRNISFKLKKFK